MRFTVKAFREVPMARDAEVERRRENR